MNEGDELMFFGYSVNFRVFHMRRIEMGDVDELDLDLTNPWLLESMGETNCKIDEFVFFF